MTGRERDNKVTMTYYVPAVIARTAKHEWLRNAWRVSVTTSVSEQIAGWLLAELQHGGRHAART